MSVEPDYLGVIFTVVGFINKKSEATSSGQGHTPTVNPFMIISISLSFHLFKKGADYCSNNHNLSVVYLELLIRIPNDIFDGDFLTITFMLYVRIVKVHPLNKKRSKKKH